MGCLFFSPLSTSAASEKSLRKRLCGCPCSSGGAHTTHDRPCFERLFCRRSQTWDCLLFERNLIPQPPRAIPLGKLHWHVCEGDFGRWTFCLRTPLRLKRNSIALPLGFVCLHIAQRFAFGGSPFTFVGSFLVCFKLLANSFCTAHQLGKKANPRFVSAMPINRRCFCLLATMMRYKRTK